MNPVRNIICTLILALKIDIETCETQALTPLTTIRSFSISNIDLVIGTYYY